MITDREVIETPTGNIYILPPRETKGSEVKTSETLHGLLARLLVEDKFNTTE